MKSKKVVKGLAIRLVATLFVIFLLLPIRFAGETMSPNDRRLESSRFLQGMNQQQILRLLGPPDHCTESMGQMKGPFDGTSFGYYLDFGDTQWLRKIGLRMVDRSCILSIHFDPGGYVSRCSVTCA